jgi:tRNA (guanine-N7-)-methyltransferase
MSSVSRKRRIRAHANPLATSDIVPPATPDDYDWKSLFPGHITKENKKQVTIADIGCGFGGLLLTLAPIFPNDLIVGIEIREPAVAIVHRSINKERAEHANDATENGAPTPYNNISCIRSNIMKYCPNYFHKGQLDKMFFLFPDPHFKRSKYRLRVINPSFLDFYAYALREGGILYTITDVEDLHLWMKRHLDEHPLFERIPDDELRGTDPCFDAIHIGTDEGRKVTRNHGSKWPAIYRRRPDADPATEGRARVDLLADDGSD